MYYIIMMKKYEGKTIEFKIEFKNTNNLKFYILVDFNVIFFSKCIIICSLCIKIFVCYVKYNKYWIGTLKDDLYKPQEFNNVKIASKRS